MEKMKSLIELLMPHGPFDACAFGVIDFKRGQFHVLEAQKKDAELLFNSRPEIYFDLASVTKPLTNSLGYFLRSGDFSSEMDLCLNHRGGLPAWGLLSKDGWREQIWSYPVVASETLYSDFSALRVMLELEKKGINLKHLCGSVWDQETLPWQELKPQHKTVQCGYREGFPNFGQVHDPNAWVIKEFCSHAGLFSTVSGVCRTILNYQEKTGFIQLVKAEMERHSRRFCHGWDRVVDPQQTLAGMGCSPFTFGHLGFTGTSIWIDAEKMRGHVILTNAVREHWYDKQVLNDLRRGLGALAWGSSISGRE